MKIALAQLDYTVGDLDGNAVKILDAYRHACARGADLVVFSELAVCGYPPRDLLLKRSFVSDTKAALENIARGMTAAPAIVGYVDSCEEKVGRPFRNAAAFIEGGTVRQRIWKSLLPTYDVFDEDRYFEPAAAVEPVQLGETRLGVTICEDIWNQQAFWRGKQDRSGQPLYQRDPVGELCAAGAEIIINISASPYVLGKERLRHDLLTAVTQHYQRPLVYVNQVGGNDELIFDGNSMALDARGQLLAQSRAFEEDIVIVDIHAGQPVRFHAPCEEESLYHALVLGLRDYAGKCGFKSLVLGLSGGIDSAVVGALAAAAVGPRNVIGVSMPSRFSSDHSKNDAEVLAHNLGIRYLTIPIEPAHKAFLEMLGHAFAGTEPGAAEENIQARVRGVVLMALSNKFGNMLVTTGNKSEMATGYCTLYGDMCGGLAVISDVPKMMVYRLAKWINREREIIPAGSITKPPSAELRPNQTDQDSLPPYDQLDRILKAYVEEHSSVAEIVASGEPEPVVRDVARRIDVNEYKRKQAPPGLKVSGKAFGIGRRMPIAQRYAEWQTK
ncbi:MAG: NAD+ synthase [Verrucomicrobia bacterium]|nr:NAD+ synthase [Verrucomicrobiota bacterium]